MFPWIILFRLYFANVTKKDYRKYIKYKKQVNFAQD